MANGPRSQTVDQQNARSAILHEAQESSMKVRALRNVKLEGLIIAIMVMFLPCGAWAAAPVAVDSLKAIYVGQPVSPVDHQAVSLLQEGLRRLYGLTLPIISDPSKVAQARDGIVLGASAALASGAVRPEELNATWPEGHVYKAGNGRIVIAGKMGWDTYFGVVTFLETRGVRFWVASLGEAKWPVAASRQIFAASKIVKPAFVFRGVWNQCEHGDPHHGANPELFDPKLTGSDLWIDHTAGYLVPKLLYYDQHPEYYAQLGSGQRIAKTAFTDHGTPLCLSNPDVTKISIERALQWVGREPDQRFFNITYGDTGIWCQCPSCRAWDPVAGQYASRLLKWVNPIAQAIRAKFPYAMVRTLAYQGTDDPPKDIIPESNVWVIVAVELGGVPFWDHALKTNNPLVAKNLAKLDGWCGIAPKRVAVCEYQGGIYNPAPLETLQSRLRFYASKGLAGIAYTYGQPLNFAPVFNYVFGKLMWDPSTDACAAANEIVEAHYGAAAPAINAYLNLSARRYQETLQTATKLHNLYPVDFYSEPFVGRVLKLFGQARKAISADAGLSKELRNEEKLFLTDVLHHPSDTLSDGCIISYCERLRAIYCEENHSAAFSREIANMVRDLEAQDAAGRFRPLIGNWLASLPEMQPKARDGSLIFTPDQLLWGDAGPTTIPDAPGQWWAGKIKAPRRYALVAWPNASNSRGVPNTAFIEARFKLGSHIGDGSGVLLIEAQDAMLTGDAEDKRSALRAKMVVSVNGVEIFAGDSGFPRGDWATRKLTIPPGVLRQGANEVRIANRSGYNFWPNTNWLCISGLTVLVGKKDALLFSYSRCHPFNPCYWMWFTNDRVSQP